MSDLTREQHLERLRSLPPDVLESIAVVCESAETAVDYVQDGDGGSMPVDDVNDTLYALGQEIRRLAPEPEPPELSDYPYAAILVISTERFFDEGDERQRVALKNGRWLIESQKNMTSEDSWLVEVTPDDVWDALRFFTNIARRAVAYAQDGRRVRIVYDLLMAGF